MILLLLFAVPTWYIVCSLNDLIGSFPTIHYRNLLIESRAQSWTNSNRWRVAFVNLILGGKAKHRMALPAGVENRKPTNQNYPQSLSFNDFWIFLGSPFGLQSVLNSEWILITQILLEEVMTRVVCLRVLSKMRTNKNKITQGSSNQSLPWCARRSFFWKR